MKISQITIENFKSYRDKQTIKFATDDHKSITLLEGQMGHGKSNLLNAFYWCLFDQYWDGDKNELIVSPDPNQVYLFNKREISERSDNGEHLEMLVEIDFVDDNGSKYKAKRTQSALFNKNQWTFSRFSKLSIKRRSFIDGTNKTFEGEDATTEVEKLFPPSLSNYFLFRGENRTELVKLQGKSKFQEALNELSKVALFTKTVRHLETVRDELRKELAEDAEEEIKQQMKAILSRKEDANRVLKSFQENLINLQDTEQKKNEEYEHYKERIKQDRNALELKGRIENEEGEIKLLGKQLDGLNENMRKQLTRKWGGLLLKNLIPQISNKYQAAVNSGTYPPDIKSSVIDKILHDLKCICGRAVTRDSLEYQLIERLKEINTYDHLIKEIESVVSNISRLENLLTAYPNEMVTYSSDADKLRLEISEKHDLIEVLSKKIGNISESLDELQRKQDAARDELLKTSTKIQETKSLISSKIEEIESIDKEYEECKKKIQKSKLPAIKANLAEKALTEAKNLKLNYEKAIYQDLEKYTQEHWDLLVYDKLNYERINLDPHEMYFEVYDKEGNPSRSIMNTGHSILLVLSFISALTRIAREVWKEEYPLVMDAPTSEVGESAIESALSGFTKVFNQAIVILKDGSVANELPQNLKEKIGKRYWIEFDADRQHSIVEPKLSIHA